MITYKFKFMAFYTLNYPKSLSLETEARIERKREKEKVRIKR